MTPPARRKSKKDPSLLFDHAMAARGRGDFKAAARDAKLLIKMAPKSPDVWQLQAMIWLDDGRPQDAVKSLGKGLGQVPGHSGLRNLLGTAYMHLGQYEQAVGVYRQAVSQTPSDPGIHNNLGNALRELGQYEDACEAYEESLRLRPDDGDTGFNHGNVLVKLRRYAEAETAFRLALAAIPEEPGILLNLSEVLIQLRRPKEALETLRRLDEMGEHSAGLFNNMASALIGLGHIEDAYAAIDRGVEVAGEDPLYATKRSFFLFLQNRWKEAWEAYESRFPAGITDRRPFTETWWNGEPLAGKRILVWGEQGLGDEIMGASMIPDLVKAGAEVALECDPRLAPAFSRAFSSVQVVARSDPPAVEISSQRFDLQSPILSLARWLRPDEASYPSAKTFLTADPARTQALRERYQTSTDTPLIGITWGSANPTIGDTKSVPLTALAPVLRTPGARFVNLQYGDTEAERRAVEAATGCRLLHDAEIDPTVDFDGHLAQVAAMDLIISISNTTVHAAGAMGVPVWVMIRHVSDRRWLLDRDDSPWYDSVRLFRQSEPEDWSGVVRRISEDLPGYLSELPS